MSYKSLCNHYCNKNVDVFIVLVIDVFVQIIVPWRISTLLEKIKGHYINQDHDKTLLFQTISYL